MVAGYQIGDAALHRLQGRTQGTLAQAVETIDGLTGTKAELLEAIAYLACQVWAYKAASDEDARLALHQIGTSIDEYRRRRAELSSQVSQERDIEGST